MLKLQKKSFFFLYLVFSSLIFADRNFIAKHKKDVNADQLSLSDYFVSKINPELRLLRLTEKNPYSSELTAKASNFEYIENDSRVFLHRPVKKVFQSRQWALPSIHLPEAWNFSRGRDEVVVAIVDTGIDETHYELRENLWEGFDEWGRRTHGRNILNKNNLPTDDNGHGTHVAGIIGANTRNASGVMGTTPKVKLMAIKFLDENGYGYKSDAIEGLTWAANHGAQITNNSWGGDLYSQALDETIAWLKRKNVLFVAAAGNDYRNIDEDPAYPAALPHDNILTVGAYNEDHTLSRFSNYSTTHVDIAAPGANIVSTWPGNRLETLSGTSMAAPYATGITALIKSADSSLNYLQLKNRLIVGATYRNAFKNKIAHHGASLNAYRAISSDIKPPPFIPPESSWSALITHNIRSPSPYPTNYQESWTMEIPHGNYFRLHFAFFDVENNYDFVRLYDRNNQLIEELTGSFFNQSIWSGPIPGRYVRIELTSGRYIYKRGFHIDAYQYSDAVDTHKASQNKSL